MSQIRRMLLKVKCEAARSISDWKSPKNGVIVLLLGVMMVDVVRRRGRISAEITLVKESQQDRRDRKRDTRQGKGEEEGPGTQSCT